MTDEDMLKEFLNMGTQDDSKLSPNSLPKDIPASQLDIIPQTAEKPVRKDEKPAPTYINPVRPEPTIQTPDPVIPYEDVQVPAVMSPLSPEHRALDQLADKWKPLFNGTVVEVKDRDVEDLQNLIHALEEKLEKIKVQKWAIQITRDGKLALADEVTRKRLKEANSEFYIQRREKGASTARSARKAEATAKSDAKAISAFEKGIKSMVAMHMSEEVIRKVLKDAGTDIPANLSAIISQFQAGK